MSDEPKKSFSVLRRWGLGLDLILRTVIVLAVVVMLNYLGARWYYRRYLNEASHQKLSTQTLALLASVTNHIKITLYYDREDPLFGNVSDLLNEYRDANQLLHVAVVDYLRDAGAANLVKEQYRNILGGTNKDMVIFDCEGRPPKAVPGPALSQYAIGQDPNVETFQLKARTVFHGEKMFNAALLAVLSPKPFRAYYLTQGRDLSLNDTAESGFSKLKSVFELNYVSITPLSLLGVTNSVPADCNLLVINGPTRSFEAVERERVLSYLRDGGRMLLMANSLSGTNSGLEDILAAYGVDLHDGYVEDIGNSTSPSKKDVYTDGFNEQHPISVPLVGTRMQFWMPRYFTPIEGLPADAPKVEWLVLTSKYAQAGKFRGTFPLAIAVERGTVKNVSTERGSTRIVAIGDSLMFLNKFIEAAANKDFLSLSINWLLERTQMTAGLAPRPVEAYRVAMTAGQLRSASWIMLAAIPGGIFILGGLVWLRRRK